MNRRREGPWLTLALAAGLASCTGRPSSARVIPQACAQQVAQLQEWTEILLEEAADSSLVLPTSLRLVPAAGAQLLRHHDEVSLALGASELSLQGTALSYDQLTDAQGQAQPLEQLTRAAQQAREITGQPPTVTVLADELAPWRGVAAAGRLATRAGFVNLRFVFRGVSRLTPPGPSWLAEQARLHLPPYDPEGPAPALGAPAPAGRQLFAACPDGAARKRRLAAVAESSTPGPDFARLQGEFLRECACGEDVEAVRQILWLLWHRDDPNQPYASVVVPLGGAPGRDAWMEQVAPETPWREAHRPVLEHAARNERFTF